MGLGIKQNTFAGPVRSGAVSLWLERDGEGFPFLLITGLGYASWCWRELRANLRGAGELLVFDNRGTGRSDKPAGPYSIAMMADDAATLLATAGISKARVLGHSMGGYIALTLAQRHPALVQSLTLVCTSPGGPGSVAAPQETRDAWAAAHAQPATEYARTTMPLSFAPGWTDAHPQEFADFLQRRLQHPTPPDCWQSQFAACMDYLQAGIDVSAIAVPALVIHGQRDRIVPYENGELLAQRMPRSHLLSLPEAGHLPFLENPQGFAETLRQHLASFL